MMFSRSALKVRLGRLTVAALALLPAACAAPGATPPYAESRELTEVPAPDAEVMGQSHRVGSSFAGNYLAARRAHLDGDFAAAADLYLKALQGDPDDVKLLSNAFAVAAAGGRIDLAAELAPRVLAADSDAALAAFLLSARAGRNGDWVGAERHLQGLGKRGLNGFMVPLMTAWARVGQGKTDAALAALEPLAGNSQFAALHQYHSALINDLAGRTKAAEEGYRAVTAGAAGVSLRAVQAAASFFQRQGQPAKAQEVVQAYRVNYPDSGLLDLTDQRVVADARQGLAEALFGAAGSVRSQAADLGLIFCWQALDLRPDFPLAQVMTADLLQSRGRINEANHLYAAMDPRTEAAWVGQLRMAENLDGLGEADAAIATLDRLLAQRPDRMDVVFAKAELQRKHKRFAEAAATYDRAISLLPQVEKRHWVLLYSRGIAYERSGQWTRAESDFLRALELEPDQPLVLNYLGYSWVEQGINFDQARRMIEKAVAQRPNDGFIVDSLGWALYRMGEYDEAVKVLDRAVELQAGDPTINDHLGDALWRVGRRDEARFQWQRALTLKPEPDAVAGIETKLKDGLKLTEAGR